MQKTRKFPRLQYSGSGLVVQPVVVLSGDRSFTRDSGDILSVNDTSDVVRCSAVNGSLPSCNSVERVEYLGSGCSLWRLLVYER